MFLVAGLGNPGEQYAATPHNLGFLVVDALAARHSIRLSRVECQAVIGQGTIEGKTVVLAKPQTFMNLSGVSVKPLMQKNGVEPKDLILVYDELALPWGSLRIRPDGSSAGHNGVQNVIDVLGRQDFPRVRLGVHPGYQLSAGRGADYLLSRFSRQQNETLEEFVGLAADATESIIAEGVSLSMTRFNRRAPGTNEEE
ncbi:MAG TPA: aminoacyl-tRNA hydrolase [Bryobacteraceae bacterium]|nr:aminoacyl-tRNA hydrolase [Bryobacteraceae bacterium]